MVGRFACIDCGRPCHGKRCLGCHKVYERTDEWRRRQSDSQNRPEVVARKSGAISALHAAGEVYGEEWRRKNSEAHGEPRVVARNRETTLALWQDPEYAARVTVGVTGAMNRPEVKVRVGGVTTARWGRGEFAHLSDLFLGSGSPMWYGGTSRDPYALGWPEVAKSIRDRDGYRCVVCGLPEEGRAFPVHHANYDKRDDDPSNLVTLCLSCHGKTGGDRDFWQPYFEGQVYLAMGAC